MNHEKGQTLMEVLVASAIGILVVTALVMATVFSLRNASFAKASAQATKLAQEGIEKVRSMRDQNDLFGGNNFKFCNQQVDSWQDPDLWSCQISHQDCTASSNCYFRIGTVTPPSSVSVPALLYIMNAADVPSGAEDPLGDGRFTRVVVLSEDATNVQLSDGSMVPSYQVQKIVTVIVRWKDAGGPHDSKLTTILRKL